MLKLNADKCVDLNGRRLKLDFYNGMPFRDSIALLPGTLKKSCGDFKVEHQQLIELVDHNVINKYTYQYDKIDILKYLENNVKGLYEVLDSFNDEVVNATKNSGNQGKV